MSVKQTDIAKALGVTKQTVTNRKAQGMPVSSVEEARAWSDQNVAHRDRIPAPDLVQQAALAPLPLPPLDPQPDSSDTAAYQASRAKREHYQAQLAQLDVMKQLGQLGSTDGFIRAVTDAAQLAQDRILQVPSRISPLIAAEVDPVKIEALLTRELKEALHGIAERAAQLLAAEGVSG